jgi:hypothetical protein
MALIECKECKKEVSKKTTSCPHCGAPLKKQSKNIGCGGAIVILFVIFFIFSSINSSMQEREAAANRRIVEQQAEQKRKDEQIKKEKLNSEYKNNNVMTTLNSKYEEGKYNEVLGLSDKYINYVKDDQLTSLRNKAKEEVLLIEVKEVPETEYQKNKNIYSQLVKLNPNEEKYKNKVDYYTNKIEEHKRIAEQKEKERINKIVGGLRKSVDKLEDITWFYDKSTPQYTNYNSFHLYIGKKKEGKSWLRLRFQYAADDWLFIKNYSIYVDGENQGKIYGSFKRDNDSTIWEWLDKSPTTSDIASIKKIIKSNEAVIRYEGQQYYKDVTITSSQKKALSNILDAYYKLGGT